MIGVEFASVWRSFGAEVTIVEALDHLAPPNEDIALSKGLERAFRRRGIAYSLGVRFASATQTADAVTVTLENGTNYEADYLLVAVGRGPPATAGLGFEEAGVQLDRGFVLTDPELRTNVEHVWAVGDIVPPVSSSPTADSYRASRSPSASPDSRRRSFRTHRCRA